MGVLTIRMEGMKEAISEVEYKTIDIIQSEQQRGKWQRKQMNRQNNK